jgi:hypothetical protein
MSAGKPDGVSLATGSSVVGTTVGITLVGTIVGTAVDGSVVGADATVGGRSVETTVDVLVPAEHAANSIDKTINVNRIVFFIFPFPFSYIQSIMTLISLLIWRKFNTHLKSQHRKDG